MLFFLEQCFWFQKTTNGLKNLAKIEALVSYGNGMYHPMYFLVQDVRVAEQPVGVDWSLHMCTLVGQLHVQYPRFSVTGGWLESEKRPYGKQHIFK